MKRLKQIFIIIPHYNEKRRLGLFKKNFSNFLSTLQNNEIKIRNKYIYTFVFVCDGTEEIDYYGKELNYIYDELYTKFISLKFSILHKEIFKNRGKGYALRFGILDLINIKKIKDYIWITDFDFPISANYFLEATKNIEDYNQSLVIGDRYYLPFLYKKDIREIIGKCFNLVVKILFFQLKSINDTQCPLKVMTYKTAKTVSKECKIRGFAFDVEFLVRFIKENGQKVSMVKVEFNNSNDSAVRIFRDSYRMLRDLLKLKYEGGF